MNGPEGGPHIDDNYVEDPFLDNRSKVDYLNYDYCRGVKKVKSAEN